MKTPSESLTITIVQNDLAWEDKQANLRSFEEMIDSHDEKMEVVLLPEMFNTGFSMKPSMYAESMEGETVQWMKRISTTKKIILAGSLMIRENDSFYNRLVWMLPGGEYGYYDKRHLFAYAGEDAEYSSGSKRLIASVKGWKLNLQVCYDLRFPVWARQTIQEEGSPEYDVLVYVANWPEKRIHAWKTLLQARAIENQCYVVGVNRIGKDGNDHAYPGESMVIDVMGNIMFSAGNMKQIKSVTLAYQPLQEARQKLPFLKDADSFSISA